MNYFSVLIICLGLIAPRLLAQDTAMPIIISADMGTGLQGTRFETPSDIDDGIVMAHALNSAAFDVKGVVVTYGNNALEPEFKIAEYIGRQLFKNSDLLIIRGAANALGFPLTRNGSPFPEGCVNEGVAFMAKQLRRESLTFVAVGPLTDVACLVQNYPNLTGNIEGITAIMGRNPNQAFSINGVQGLIDFNYANDPEAVRIILEESTVPITFMSFELTSASLVTRKMTGVWSQDKSEKGRFFYQASQPWISFWNRVFGEDGFHPWDSNALSVLNRPQWFTCEERGFSIVTCTEKGDSCAGHSEDPAGMLAKEASQLWFDKNFTSRTVQVCHAYASMQAKKDFLQSVIDF